MQMEVIKILYTINRGLLLLGFIFYQHVGEFTDKLISKFIKNSKAVTVLGVLLDK